MGDSGLVNGGELWDPVPSPSPLRLIAAEFTGRICLGIEIDPLYVDVAVRRWQAFTGQQATLQAGGQSFEAVAADRRPTDRPDKANPGGSNRQAAGKTAASKPVTHGQQARQVVPPVAGSPMRRPRPRAGNAKTAR